LEEETSDQPFKGSPVTHLDLRRAKAKPHDRRMHSWRRAECAWGEGEDTFDVSE
jgi:hypothetical protein